MEEEIDRKEKNYQEREEERDREEQMVREEKINREEARKYLESSWRTRTGRRM